MSGPTASAPLSGRLRPGARAPRISPLGLVSPTPGEGISGPKASHSLPRPGASWGGASWFLQATHRKVSPWPAAAAGRSTTGPP